jgi:hypothetical protein
VTAFVLLLGACASGARDSGTVEDTAPVTAPVFTWLETVDLGGVTWSIPVFDGTDLVVSTETADGIWATRFDLDLAQIGEPVLIASTADTGGQALADHKHVFLGGNHYIAFSISGDGMGGDLYLVKLDGDLARLGIVQVVDDDPPTNDMFLVGGQGAIYVGKFLPGTGHRVYAYDEGLALVRSFEVGGSDGTVDNRHANGAGALFDGDRFHLVAPETLQPGAGNQLFRLVFDAAWNVEEDRKTIVEDPGMLGIASGLSQDPTSGTFLVHYARSADAAGGPLVLAVFDPAWGWLAQTVALDGTFQRPHSVLVEDRLYLGYDGGGTHLSMFARP